MSAEHPARATRAWRSIWGTSGYLRDGKEEEKQRWPTWRFFHESHILAPQVESLALAKALAGGRRPTTSGTSSARPATVCRASTHLRASHGMNDRGCTLQTKMTARRSLSSALAEAAWLGKGQRNRTSSTLPLFWVSRSPNPLQPSILHPLSPPSSAHRPTPPRPKAPRRLRPDLRPSSIRPRSSQRTSRL